MALILEAMVSTNKKVLLISPSIILARGLECIFATHGEFEICGILSDISSGNEGRLRSIDPDIIIIDPIIYDFEARLSPIKGILSEFNNTALVAVSSIYLEEDAQKQYDGIIGLYDSNSTVINKLRTALNNKTSQPKPQNDSLSCREREILVSVAKGKINKEIANELNISISTVITHRKNISKKIGIKTIAGFTVYALLNNLIDQNVLEEI